MAREFGLFSRQGGDARVSCRYSRAAEARSYSLSRIALLSMRNSLLTFRLQPTIRVPVFKLRHRFIPINVYSLLKHFEWERLFSKLHDRYRNSVAK